ncbi:MAG: efflux RND transporter permease subunit, partial [Gammaproteobacteria bacterium]
LDNKAEFKVVIDMPSGTALPITANVAQRLVDELRKNIPEITALQSYVGTFSPFDFNGMVRHYYLRQESWQGVIEVQLLDKHERERTNHEIAMAARDLLTPIGKELGVRNLTFVEMPPGPPVLQSIVAEVYGPTDEVRRQVAKDLTEMFRKVPFVVDVDNYMLDPHDVLHFKVDTEKSVRRGISTDTINRNLAMAMGGFRLGDVKQGRPLEPIFVVIQVPLQERSQLGRILDLPMPAAMEPMIPVIPQALVSRTIPLAELGRFVREPVDPIIYHKDLRPIEYVVGDVVGRLGAPIYGMFAVQNLLKDYTAPDGSKISPSWFGPPRTSSHAGFEWSGEWTVTLETFSGLGVAFVVALFFIYMLIVGEFGNFILPAVIMAPIPLTMIGIIPGHWLINAPFTATSMIGFIALAGIIVRNSILLVDFAKIEVEERGRPVEQAVVMACEARTRPILITALALVLDASVMFTDPIFQGMAASLAFGVLASTLLTLIVIPLGCISARRGFNPPSQEKGGPPASPTPSGEGEETAEETEEKPSKMAKLRHGLSMALQLILGVIIGLTIQLLQLLKRLLLWVLQRLLERIGGKEAPPAESTLSPPSPVQATPAPSPPAEEVPPAPQPQAKASSPGAQPRRKQTKAGAPKRRGIRVKTDVASPKKT